MKIQEIDWTRNAPVMGILEKTGYFGELLESRVSLEFFLEEVLVPKITLQIGSLV